MGMRRWTMLVAVAIAGFVPALVLPGAAPVHAISGLPAGFTSSSVGSANVPISVTAIPSGAVVLEKGGRVRVVRDGVLLGGSALDLTTRIGGCGGGERGLLGFAIDPDFGANGRVFIYYTRPNAAAPGNCVNRVSRFTMSGNSININSEVVLLDNIGSPAGNHNGGDVEVGNDGYLYVSVGDGGCDPRSNSGCAGDNDAAQDLSLLNGKILRVDRVTGAPAAGNPLSGPGTAACRIRGNMPSTPTTWCQEIFAWGLRNPWRIAFDPNTGGTRFYINDVGQGTREEVDLGEIGKNYGWPEREGFCEQAAQTPCAPPDPADNYTQPITDYSHTNGRADFGGEYITGGAFVPNGAWRQGDDGGYLFSDGNPGRMFLRPATPPVNPNSVYQSPFATGLGGVSDIGFVMEPTGWALYYVQPSGTIGRVAHTLPAAVATGTLKFSSTGPTRVFDTRNLGPATGPIRAWTSRLVNVVEEQGAHRAALVNITHVRPSSTGYLTVWQPRTPRPTASNINGTMGEVAANASVVPIDENGDILVFASATGHVVIDLLGFFDVSGSTDDGRFQPVDPIRAIDTRELPDPETNNYTRSAVGGDSLVEVPIEGSFGVDSTAAAVALIVTASADSDPDSGYVVAFPGGGTQPSSSNVNTSGNGDVRANLVVVPLGGDGSVDFVLHVTADVIVDVVGFFTNGTAADDTAGLYVSAPPNRVIDTRQSSPFGRLTAGGTGTIDPAGVPAGSLGVTQNLVMIATGGRGYLTAYPATEPEPPLVSNVNSGMAGQVRSAFAITVLGDDEITYFASIDTHLVVDVTGYFIAGSG